MKKPLSLILIFVLTVICFNFSVKADNLLGEGTQENPYLITNAEQLNMVKNHLSSHFILNNDIDLGNTEFLPIGTKSSPFSGSFNGNGKKITGLTYNFNGNANDNYNSNSSEGSDDYITEGDNGWTGDYELGNNPSNPSETQKIPQYIGLFGVNSGSIYDLHLENANISVTALQNDIYVGGIVGLNKGEVFRCYSTVSKIVTACEKTDYCGGIIGLNEQNANVGNCFTNNFVKAKSYAAGLIGLNNGSIACSFYNGFFVEAESRDAVCNGINSNYCYYLQGNVLSAGAKELTADNFAYSSYFNGFNFSNVWQINGILKQPELKNNPYPTKLTAEAPNKPVVKEINGNTVTFETDGSLLFSNDGVNFSFNNVFNHENGKTVKYYARYAETVSHYQSKVSEYLELSLTKSYDINGDGETNSKDLTQLRRYLADWDVTVVFENLDASGDSETNSKDATYLARYFAGWYD